MTKKQEKFALWLKSEAPYLLPLFDFNKRIYFPEKVDHYFSTCSSGEEIMLRFFLSVWRGDNHFNFDLMNAVLTLNESNMKIIRNWINDPFFP